jgi:hypothetical protein
MTIFTVWIIGIIFACLIFAVSSKFRTVSYTSEGTWTNATADQCSHFLCTSKKETWASTNPKFKFYNATTGCEALLKKNITQIHFHGDSYMRQIYSAMLITLLGDYKYGSIRDGKAFPQCAYHMQFNEKTCGLKELNHYGWICDKKILLDPLLNGFDNLRECKPGYVKLWSFGNHKLGPSRFGVNDAKAYSSSFDRSICPQIRDAVARNEFDGFRDKSCQVFWVSTHYRIIGWFDDEKEEVVKNFNTGMRSYFDSGRCGPINYIDVYNMTLGLKDKPENIELSYDRVHWGMEVNLIKAQIVLNAILDQY